LNYTSDRAVRFDLLDSALGIQPRANRLGDV
jgi:hypothetical protein